MYHPTLDRQTIPGRRWKWLAGLLLLALLGACGKSPPPPSIPKVSEKDIERCLTGKLTVREGYRYHMLEEGETLYRVSVMYGTTVEELIEVNNIEDYTDIPAGTM